MVITKSGRICGSVSAGCIESAVIQEARLVLERGINKILHFSGEEDDFSISLSCGGRLDILLQPIQDGIGRVSGDIYLTIRDTLVQRKTVITATDIMGKESGRIRILDPNHADKNLSLDADSASKWKDFLDKDQCGLVSMGERSLFIDFWKRKPRMVIVGAGHIAVALAEIAKTIDYYVAVVDPRSVFTTRERFPMVDALITRWPQDAEKILEISHEDHLVILSHDEKIDLPALKIGLDRRCDYIGFLASNLTKKKRFSSLASMGYKQYQLRMISSPIGLNIKADQPEEIAVAIMAEIIVRT